jgi:hypothetical protein
MTNTTILLNSDTHGAFRVDADMLATTIFLWGAASITFLHGMIHDLVGIEVDIAGQGSYSDLDRASALVVITYLTGGAAEPA